MAGNPIETRVLEVVEAEGGTKDESTAKRPRPEEDPEAAATTRTSTTANKRRKEDGDDGENDDTNRSSRSIRWKVHQLTENYVELSSNLMLTPLSELGPYGYDPGKMKYPLEAVSALSYLKSPLRRPLVIERWSPYELAVFEAAIAQHGKEFHKIQQEIGSKTTKEVIDFYYMWKKTTHYQRWKKQYIPPYLDVSDDEEETTKK